MADYENPLARRYISMRRSEAQAKTPMLFSPVDGKPNPMLDDAQAFRSCFPHNAWLFDPWTREVRTSSEVGKDVFGNLIDPSPVLHNLSNDILNLLIEEALVQVEDNNIVSYSENVNVITSQNSIKINVVLHNVQCCLELPNDRN